MNVKDMSAGECLDRKQSLPFDRILLIMMMMMIMIMMGIRHAIKCVSWPLEAFHKLNLSQIQPLFFIKANSVYRNMLTAYRLTWMTAPLGRVELCQVPLCVVHNLHSVLTLTGLESIATAHCGHTHMTCVFLLCPYYCTTHTAHHLRLSHRHVTLTQYLVKPLQKHAHVLDLGYFC